MATTVVKSVGNGTRDYTSIAAFLAARPASLVSADQIWEAQIYPEGAGTNGEWTTTAEISVSGVTTDSTRFTRLRAAPGYSFSDTTNRLTNALRYNPANGVAIRCTGMYVSQTIRLNEPYAELVGLQISHQVQRPLRVDNTAPKVSNCLIASTTAYPAITAIGAASVINSIITSTTATAPLFTNGVVANYVGCTIYGAAGTAPLAANIYGGTAKLTSCNVFGYTGATTAVNSGSSYNATNLASMAGTNNTLNLTASAQFTDISSAAALDLRPKSGNGLQVGTLDALMGGVDVFGQTRATPPTAGAVEYVTAGGSTGLTIADATHGHTTDGVSLAITPTLAPADGAHAHAADACNVATFNLRIAVLGDSNASGRGTNNQTYTGSGAYLFNNAGAIVTLADPWDGGTNTYAALDDGASALGSYVPRLAQRYINAGLQQLWIPVNKGGTTALDWQPSLSTSTCYGAAKARIDNAGGADIIIIHLGANDAMSGVSQATFKTRIETIVTQLKTDYPSAKVYLPKIHYFSGYTTAIAAIRAGVDDVWNGSSGALRCADLDGITTSVHYSSDAELDAVAARLFSSLISTDISVQGAIHDHAADSLALTTQWLLSISEALHGHTAESISLSSSDSTSLSVVGSSHAHAADNLALATQQLLAIADALHAHAADNEVLDTSSAVWLTVQEALHAHASDSLGLSLQTWLVIADAVQAHFADATVLGVDSGSFTGSLSDADIARIVAALPSASDIAAALLAALNSTTIPVDMIKVKGQAINGSGSEADPWGP